MKITKIIMNDEYRYRNKKNNSSCFKFMNSTNIFFEFIKNTVFLLMFLFIVGFAIFIYLKIDNFLKDIKQDISIPLDYLRKEITDFKNDTIEIVNDIKSDINKTIIFIEDIPHEVYSFVKNKTTSLF